MPACVSQKTNKVSSISPNSTVNHDNNNSTVQFYPRFYHLNTNTNWQEKRIEIRQQQQQKGPCSCAELNCGCCAGMRFRQFKRICKYLRAFSKCRKINRNISSPYLIYNGFFFSLLQFHIRSEWISNPIGCHEQWSSCISKYVFGQKSTTDVRSSAIYTGKYVYKIV